jgi:hypothetical protein
MQSLKTASYGRGSVSDIVESRPTGEITNCRAATTESGFFYLNFNVVKANNAITKPAIQKRVMILDSGQPSASK